MKKAIRIIVPILLIFAIIGSLLWYLLVYDREFTRDFLLHQARSFEESGNHKAAAWFYNLAYEHASQDDSVAIELAQQYIDNGNYAKAEYTLSNAIADGPTTELYMALCKTYVDQDKLLDAVQMLDHIADPAIKAELDAMRPSLPQPDKEPDFYSEYISVAFTAQEGTLYATTDGRYPSLSYGACAEPIPLDSGVTTILALAVTENGLVSKLGTFDYTINGVIEPVTFADSAFEAAIRSLLEVDSDDVIYSDALWTMDTFYMPEDVKSYEDLVWLPHLRSLTIDSCATGQLTYLSSVSELTELTVTKGSVTAAELEAIASLPSLTRLTLSDCGLSSIAPLAAASRLEYLDLSNNAIRNLEPLAAMTQLQQLYLSHNALTELTQLKNLQDLNILDVSYNSLLSIDPICGIVGLTDLDVCYNQLSSLGNIGNLTSLTRLVAASNTISDVSRLASCTQLTELDISNNAVADITALSTLTNLIRFNFSYNQITALPLWESGSLTFIDGSYNLLTSLEELKVMTKLNAVFMDYNEAIESVEPLRSCPHLVQVNVYGTLVTEVGFLTDQNVIVNFNPTLEE